MPIDEKILKLIKFIVCYAVEQDVSLTTVRLVKFLYLADLYNARWFNGETITKFPWAFVYYGPYCSEAFTSLETAATEGIISKTTYESRYGDKDFSLFTCRDDRYTEIKRMFPTEVISELQYAIKKWGDDTGQLLDHVYFETEPMEGVRKGDRLDFSKARKPRPRSDFQIETKKMSPDAIASIKKHLNKLKEKRQEAMTRLIADEKETEKWKDEIYKKTLESIDDEPFPEGISGTARIVL
jgi:hypothetical protein